MVFFGIYLIVCLFTLIYGMDMVYPELAIRSFTQYIVLVGVSPLFTMSGNLLQAWYVFLVAAIVASAVWVAVTSRRKFVDELLMRGDARNHSSFFDLSGLMFMVLFVNTMIVLMLMALGSDPADPTEEAETWELLFLLANASVWEEIIARVLLIGMPLIALDAARRQRRKPWKYVTGGGVEITGAEVVLILLSAGLFGLGHLEGWGAWKVFPAGLAGVAFGYMFLRHGLASAIFLHFSFDYLSAPLLVFEDSVGVLLTLGIGMYLWLGAGLVFLAYYGIRVVEFFSGKKYFEVRRTVVARPAPMPPWQAPRIPSAEKDDLRTTHGAGRGVERAGGAEYLPGFGGGFVCPACGATQARWLTAGLQCLRCGRILK